MKFQVTGFASVPVKVRIEIEASDADTAMKLADRKFNRGGIGRYIVAGSDDTAAAFDFSALNAETIQSADKL